MYGSFSPPASRGIDDYDLEEHAGMRRLSSDSEDEPASSSNSSSSSSSSSKVSIRHSRNTMTHPPGDDTYEVEVESKRRGDEKRKSGGASGPKIGAHGYATRALKVAMLIIAFVGIGLLGVTSFRGDFNLQSAYQDATNFVENMIMVEDTSTMSSSSVM